MKRQHWFWLGVVGLLIVAAVPRLLIYDFSLPYIDHPDEPNYYLEVQKWRGIYEPGGSIVGYPPAFLYLSYGVQMVTEAWLGYGTTVTLSVMRLISAGTLLVMVVVIAQTARVIGREVAGLLAALPIVLNPWLLPRTVYATADPHVYLWAAIAFGAAVFAIERRASYVVLSTVAGLLAALFKYSALPLMGVGLLTTVLLGWRRADERGRLTWLFVGQVIVIAAVGLWLLFGYGAGQFGISEADTFRSDALQNLFVPGRVLNNLWYVFAPFTPLLVLSVIVGGLALWVINRRVFPGDPLTLVPAAFIVISVPWFVSSYSQVSLMSRLKDVLPTAAVVCVLFGVFVAGIVRWVGRPRLAWGAVAVMMVVAHVMPAYEMVSAIPAYRYPDARVMLRQWADENLTAGTVLVDRNNHKTFNPFWSGIQGRQWFDWIVVDDITQNTVEEWRTGNGVQYAAISLDHRDGLTTTDAGRQMLDNMLHLKTINPTPARGYGVAVYRLDPIPVPLDATFGESIVLRGIDDYPATVTAGEALPLRFYWTAPQRPRNNYNLFVHLLSPEGEQPVAQWDGPLAVDSRLTLTWDDPGETLISPVRQLNIPADLAPGTYRLVAGLYDFETGERLPVAGGDALSLGTVEVVASPSA